MKRMTLGSAVGALSQWWSLSLRKEELMTRTMRVSRAGLVGALLASSFVIGCAVDDELDNDPGIQELGVEDLSVDRFHEQAIASGLTDDQAARLQERVDEVLAEIPGGRQISATELSYDGLNVTFDPVYSEEGAVAPAAISCSAGWFCIVVGGTTFSFFKCQTWSLSNWLGNAPFNNNQTTGTVARAYDSQSRQIWSHRAKGSGTANVTPWWFFRPC
jgi:hypothetical protein